MTQRPAPDHGSSAPSDRELQREIDEAIQGHSVEQLIEQAGPIPDGAAPPQGSGEQRGVGRGDQTPAFHHELRRGQIAAIRGEDVFIELLDQTAKLQGVVPLNQFERPPRLGSTMDFVVQKVDEDEGLVLLAREGAVSRATWEQLERGAVVEARVVSTNRGGLKMEMIGDIRAFMPASQIDLHHVGDLEAFVGRKLECIVQEIDRRSKKVVLNRRQHLEQQREAAKTKLLAELEEGQVRDGVVSGLADFGAFVDLGGIDGLVHLSDLSYRHVNQPSDVVSVGQRLNVKVLKIDPKGQRISLGLKQIEPDPWESLTQGIKVGDQVQARVVRIASFGAFVEVEPSVEGLVPISEMSWKRIGMPDEVVTEGQVLRLAVIGIDPNKRRISLSLKQAQPDPWIGAERKYPVNSLVEGKVLGTTDFGAFIELESGVEGLVHISELSEQRVKRVEQVLQVGQSERFRVLEVNEQRRRLSLSLKKTTEPVVQTGPPSVPAKAAVRDRRKDLKGGTGVGGIGLGNLRLDDLK